MQEFWFPLPFLSFFFPSKSSSLFFIGLWYAFYATSNGTEILEINGKTGTKNVIGSKPNFGNLLDVVDMKIWNGSILTYSNYVQLDLESSLCIGKPVYARTCDEEIRCGLLNTYLQSSNLMFLYT